MKKSIIIVIYIALLAAIFAGCASNSNNQADIEGTWQAYASLDEDEIVPFEEGNLLMAQSITFKDDKTIVMENAEVRLVGTYESTNDGYEITIPFGNSNEIAVLSCKLNENNLIVTQEPPEGFEDYDSGDPTVYKRIK